ncbi:hypothetical protein, partial [Acinetobacter baumannii]|uniref:hypothetical protein n=1 Tax=Acinetobacter baumannii TaxID=470 RepID=UPI0014479157
FGSDLNHKEQFDFTPLLKQSTNVEDLQSLYDIKKEFLSVEDIANAERILNNKEVRSYEKLFKTLQSL